MATKTRRIEQPPTYTVRPLGMTAWAERLATLADAEAAASEAVDRGLRAVVIVNDATGDIESEWDQSAEDED